MSPPSPGGGALGSKHNIIDTVKIAYIFIMTKDASGLIMILFFKASENIPRAVCGQNLQGEFVLIVAPAPCNDRENLIYTCTIIYNHMSTGVLRLYTKLSLQV